MTRIALTLALAYLSAAFYIAAHIAGTITL